MDRGIVGMMLTGFFVALFSSSTLLAEQGAQGKSLWEEVKAHNEKDVAYNEAKKVELLKLESQISELRSQRLNAKDEASKKQFVDRVKGLQLQKTNLMEEFSKHEVESAEQAVTFAQRRLELAKARLAEIEKRKSERENKESK